MAKKSGHMTHDQVVVKESFSIDFHYPLIFLITKILATNFGTEI